MSETSLNEQGGQVETNLPAASSPSQPANSGEYLSADYASPHLPPQQGHHLIGQANACTVSRANSTLSRALQSNSSCTAPRPMDISESLRGLHEVFQRGGLTQEEFAQAKQQVLKSSSSSSPSRASTGRSKRRGGSPVSREKKRKRGSHTKSKNSSSSSSSSSSSTNRFIVVPRAKLWRHLNTERDSVIGDSAPMYPLDDEFGCLDVCGSNGGVGGADGEEPTGHSPLFIAAAGPSFDPEGRRQLHTGDSEGDWPLPAEGGNSTLENSGGAHGVLNRASHVGVSVPISGGSNTSKEQRQQQAKYGTFLHAWNVTGSGAAGSGGGAGAGGMGGKVNVELSPEDEVQVCYFNSRGACGSRFSEVVLQEHELRPPCVLHKRGSVPLGQSGAGTGGRTEIQHDEVPGMLSGYGHMQRLAESELMGTVVGIPQLTEEERRVWEEMTRTSSSSSSSSSILEQSLNWYWIDVCGRDASRRRYNTALRFLTRKFQLCESFLVDREHVLMLPQVCESPNYPGQYLLNLRVATHKISISDDSVLELTNRWIIVVDLVQHIVLTLHRLDTYSMALLRSQWSKVLDVDNNVSFQEFLLKIIDDAIYTYQLSLDVHADLLDKCELKLFVQGKNPSQPGKSAPMIDSRILHHFAGSSRSPFLHKLMDENDKSPPNKGEMNTFLHHLHRRTSVQHRMLNLTEVVLAQAFTKLHLCSKELASQMCASCMELSDKALEVRDDAKTLLDLHISLQTFRTNELMAVLTRVSMFFTPCTFLAGVYGMNFHYNFPELDWEYGYPFFWILCLSLVLGMQLYFFRGTF